MSDERRDTFGQFKRFFAPPVYEGDKDKTRAAALLNTVLLSLFALGSLLTLITALLSVGDPTILGRLAIGVATATLSLVMWFIARRGYVRAASIAIVSVLLVNATLAISSDGSIRSPLGSVYVLCILIAGLLIGTRAAVIFAALSLLALLGLHFAETWGLLNSSPKSSSELTDWATYAAVFSVSTIILGLATRRIKAALRRALQNEGALAESNRLLEANRTALRERNEMLRTTVQQYDDYMVQVGRGDLSGRLPLNGNGHRSNDPMIALGRRLNETVASLHGMIVQTRETADDLGSAAAAILAATTQQAFGTGEQSAAISETTTTVDEVRAIAEQSVTRAKVVAQAARRTLEVSQVGQQSVQETIQSMAQIKVRVEGIAENILALSEQTQQIGEIISTVNDIASQSNMLALNASVEAARAGEHGKGFSVVAVEVRNLAEQSRQATAQVKAILSDIQRATNATVMATEEGIKGVDAGVDLASQAQDAIEQLSGVIDESAQAAMQMVAGGQQQASGIEQISVAMGNINQATVQSLASTRQAEKAAQDLNGLARSLREVVGRYQV
jgi:methyl-accepting chemotaxis protein